MLNRIRTLDGIETASLEDLDQRQILHVQTPLGQQAIPVVVRLLESEGLRIGRVSAREPTLEDAYVRLVSGEGR